MKDDKLKVLDWNRSIGYLKRLKQLHKNQQKEFFFIFLI